MLPTFRKKNAQERLLEEPYVDEIISDPNVWNYKIKALELQWANDIVNFSTAIDIYPKALKRVGLKKIIRNFLF